MPSKQALPEIVDLTSDNEDEINIPSQSPHPTRVNATAKASANTRVTGGTVISQTAKMDFDDTRSCGSRTECGSQSGEDDVHDVSTSTPFQKASQAQVTPTRGIKSVDRGKGKGKGKEREQEITTVDLSYLDSDDEISNSESGFKYDLDDYSGDWSGDEALRRAIALSLQDQRTTNDINGGSGSGKGKESSQDGEKDDEVNGGKCTETAKVKEKELIQREMPQSSNLGDNDDAKTMSPSPQASSNPKQLPALSSSADSKLVPNPGSVDASTLNVPSTFSLASLNRKQMEADRLDRLAQLKRKRDDEDEQRGKVARVRQAETLTEVTVLPSMVRQAKKPMVSLARHISTSAGGSDANGSSEKIGGTTQSKGVGLKDRAMETSTTKIIAPNKYPDGMVFKTYVAGYPTTNTIDFTTLISPASSLASCLLSSFIWDFDWLLPHFETRRTKFQLVVHAKTHLDRHAVTNDFKGIPNVRLCFPSMDANVNCMHSKLMLLFFKEEDSGKSSSATWQGERCRIVVPTANLVGFDWGVGGFMENTVWLIDLPAKSGTTSASLSDRSKGAETQFQKSLRAFLKAQTVPDDVIRNLGHFDFSRTARIGFVHTIGGMHVGEAWKETGLGGLGRTISELGLAAGGSIQLDYVTSSTGNLNDEFMTSMYLAAQGDDSLTEYSTRTAQKEAQTRQVRRTWEDWRNKFRIYFPSDKTVRESKGGIQNAGTICSSARWWQSGKFPTSCMRDCVSVREGLLMHNKIMFARFAWSVESCQSVRIGWAYVGSANMSESAWGRLVQDRSTKEPRLNCRNWECGVIIPVDSRSPNIRAPNGTDAGNLAMFDHLVPVPMKYPAETFEGKKPWTTFT
ncbi:uncharacterized protein Z518_04383 [Rhinocladiella mackenziei CBS 650.93]|uniref:PLD phosphodiesterase domain-containing protein n=1 Tax=Rhinocladiella mackenziei CBS 650.93 TaxID=1442369 RepID=A0A0D2FW66_9EURO|nr:uncharacterized protein Z518_04383 [Rhinocladiella mackenziei CBS 650.93]KIX06407.1 hypothetical protein Z518_04383 [Rhinocladiella mackenziei CBS 650.93]